MEKTPQITDFVKIVMLPINTAKLGSGKTITYLNYALEIKGGGRVYSASIPIVPTLTESEKTELVMYDYCEWQRANSQFLKKIISNHLNN